MICCFSLSYMKKSLWRHQIAAHQEKNVDKELISMKKSTFSVRWVFLDIILMWGFLFWAVSDPAVNLSEKQTNQSYLFLWKPGDLRHRLADPKLTWPVFLLSLLLPGECVPSPASTWNTHSPEGARSATFCSCVLLIAEQIMCNHLNLALNEYS